LLLHLYKRKMAANKHIAEALAKKLKR